MFRATDAGYDQMQVTHLFRVHLQQRTRKTIRMLLIVTLNDDPIPWSDSDRLLSDRDGVFNACNPRDFLSDRLRGLPHEAGTHFAGQVHDVIQSLNVD